LLSAEVFLSKARQQLIDAENKANLAIASLNEIIGMPNASWKSTTALQDHSYSSNPLSYWIDQMMNNRAELKIAGDSKEIAQRQVSITNSQFLPSIQAWSNYQWHGDSFDYTGNSWGVGVELNWNLFHGFSDKGRLSSAKFNSEKAAERVRETENALRLQVESAYYHFLAAQQKYQVTESTLKQAEENRRIYAERYESGLVSIQDSLQADASYSEARLMHLQNLYEIQTAYAELLGASGKADDLVQQKASDL
jgi:outer membrane protein TolC